MRWPQVQVIDLGETTVLDAISYDESGCVFVVHGMHVFVSWKQLAEQESIPVYVP